MSQSVSNEILSSFKIFLCEFKFLIMFQSFFSSQQLRFEGLEDQLNSLQICYRKVHIRFRERNQNKKMEKS